MNTHSLDLERSSSQDASIAHASQTGLGFAAGDFTLEAWVKLESSPIEGEAEVFVSKSGTSNQNVYQFDYPQTSSVFYLRMVVSSNGNNVEVRQVAQTLTTNRWYHVAAATTASTNTTEFFVNGVSIGSASGSISGLSSGTSAFRIGGSDAGGTLDGKIDEVRAWDVVRSGANILANMKRELVGNESNLQGYWKLNNNYQDATSNNNDLTANNSPVFTTDIPFSERGAFLFNLI